MNENERNKRLALALLHADSEDEVITILKKAGYWDDRRCWRLYGDKEGNFAQAGNQQSLPEAAFVEKIINCVDSRLMNACLAAGINPEGDDAPTSVRDAVAMFFENRRATDNEAGTLINWQKTKRTDESRSITVAATGDKPTPGRRSKKMCLTIVDQGEGQSADRLPRTILSLNAKNKQRIRFVQGKFNMGGSGALRFCGEDGIQLVISRRSPVLAAKEAGSDSTIYQWAVTVVRREEPSNKTGEPIHSEFTYLAPVNAETRPRKGDILSFDAETLPLMPLHDDPYCREIPWGTAIKLYEYETSVGQSNILMKDGLLFALERLLPEVALPIRLHECRGYKGVKERSFETTVSGLVVRLEDGKGDNLEESFPISVRVSAGGMNMTARIYAFKEDRAETYLKDEGVIFMINGQAHGNIPKSIFTRPKSVNLPRLRDSLLVLTDCSSLTARQREDLFMSSRDRLSKKPIRYQLEEEIEQLLKNNPALRSLQQKRREQDVESKLSDERPLEEVLSKVLRSSPTLNSLFLRGQRLSKPFASGAGGTGSGPNGTGDEQKPFRGNRHPTYFRFEKLDYGTTLKRNCETGRRVRITFTTDVENDYFDRATDRGFFELEPIGTTSDIAPPDFSVSLEDGYAHLNLALPDEANVGDTLTLQATVLDPTLLEPFTNIVQLKIAPKQNHTSGNGENRKRKGGGTGSEASIHGIALPKVIPVEEGDEHWRRHHFNHHTACYVISEGVDGDESRIEHVFYINLDNDSLKTEMKYSKQDPRLLQAKFKYGNVLLGLAMLHEEETRHRQERNGAQLRPDETQNGEDRRSVQDNIRDVSSALAPVLIPMIDELSGLEESDFEQAGILGEGE